MESGVLKKGIRPRRHARAGRLAFVAATLLVGAFASAPASAALLDEVDLPPLPLPSLLPSIEEEASGTVDGVVNTINSVPEQLGGIVNGSKPPATAPVPKAVAPKIPQVDSWSIDRLPALSGSPVSVPTSVSSSKLERPGSYTSLVGDGFRAAAGRAAHLAGPLAAPLMLALFALLMLALAARGPGRLVKVDEDRQAFRERRSHRL